MPPAGSDFADSRDMERIRHMTVSEIIKLIEGEVSPEKALDWDNVGLLVGDPTSRVRRIYLALDATDPVIEHAAAWNADLLLTHHPLIFSGVKSVTEETFLGRRIRTLIRNDISCYAMHTNFDVCVMGKLAARKLGLKNAQVLEVCGADDGIYGIGSVGVLEEPITLKKLAEKTAEVFGLSHVKVFGDGNRQVCRTAVCPGAGKSDVKYALQAGADVYITGDIDHHTGIDAVAEGLTVIDAGHYGVEHIFMDYMSGFLQERISGIEVASEPLQEPFWICSTDLKKE